MNAHVSDDSHACIYGVGGKPTMIFFKNTFILSCEISMDIWICVYMCAAIISDVLLSHVKSSESVSFKQFDYEYYSFRTINCLKCSLPYHQLSLERKRIHIMKYTFNELIDAVWLHLFYFQLMTYPPITRKRMNAFTPPLCFFFFINVNFYTAFCDFISCIRQILN